MTSKFSNRTELYLRNIVFGTIDSLVSTVGLLAGVSVSGASRHNIIATGIIYALVEAFSMAVGSFLSEQSVEEYDAKRNVGIANPAVGGMIMFVTFVLVSFIPLAPYAYFPASSAIWFSIGFSVVALFVTGIVAAKISKISVWRQGISMAALGASAIII